MSTVRLRPLGDCAYTLELGQGADRQGIDLRLNARVHALAEAISSEQQQGSLPEVIECLPAFCAVTVYYNPLLGTPETLSQRLLALAERVQADQLHGRELLLPVCFGGEYGEDLEPLAKSLGLTPESVIHTMTSTEFTVCLIGFMPGFPYMGGLPEALQVPRLSNPRQQVPERSVAIAGAMCAVYPWSSPGGWHLLGRTPVPLFSLSHPEAPTLFQPGDRVRWQAITAEQYRDWEERFATQRSDWAELSLPQREAA